MIPGTECGQQLRKAQDTYYWVNPYDILTECYVPEKGSGRGPLDMSQNAGYTTKSTADAAATTTWRSAMLGHTVPCADRRCVSCIYRMARRCSDSTPTPDVDFEVTTCEVDLHICLFRAALYWLSKPEVRRAIHAVSVYELPWQPCSDILNYTLNTPISVTHVHKELVAAGLR